jgi:pilus assembly protein CpaE
LHDGGADQYVSLDELEHEVEDVIERAHPSARGTIVTVMSVGGGAGASTLAANLAAALAKEDSRCALVDLNLQFGDLASLLDLKPTRTIADLCRNSARVDRAMFEQLLASHETGIDLLAAPLSFEDERIVTPEGVVTALKMAQDLFDHVVVDVDHTCRAEQAAALRLAKKILIVLRLDYTASHNLRRIGTFLKSLGIDSSKTCLIANGCGRPKLLKPRDVEEALKIKIDEFLPDDPRHINVANNKGVPVVVEFPSAKYSRGVVKLAQVVKEETQVTHGSA